MISRSSVAAENWLLLGGLGLLTYLGILSTWRLLRSVAEDARQEPPDTKQWITQATEDALKETTLSKLINSHNPNIKSVAERIVCDRALYSQATIVSLLWDATRPDHRIRERALRALQMLTLSGMISLNCRLFIMHNDLLSSWYVKAQQSTDI